MALQTSKCCSKAVTIWKSCVRRYDIMKPVMNQKFFMMVSHSTANNMIWKKTFTTHHDYYEAMPNCCWKFKP
jgi:hypothetical protein